LNKTAIEKRDELITSKPTNGLSTSETIAPTAKLSVSTKNTELFKSLSFLSFG
ncbi:unnamed protein product, partial [marine sediment metagenome]